MKKMSNDSKSSPSPSPEKESNEDDIVKKSEETTTTKVVEKLDEKKCNDNDESKIPTITIKNEKQNKIGRYTVGRIMSKNQKLSDLQKFVAHQDFGLFILMATKVKVVKMNLICGNTPDTGDVISITHAQSRKGEDEMNAMAELLQSTLLLGKKTTKKTKGSLTLKSIIIPRGRFYITDNLMEEAINSLLTDFNIHMTWYNSYVY